MGENLSYAKRGGPHPCRGKLRHLYHPDSGSKIKEKITIEAKIEEAKEKAARTELIKDEIAKIPEDNTAVEEKTKKEEKDKDEEQLAGGDGGPNLNKLTYSNNAEEGYSDRTIDELAKIYRDSSLTKCPKCGFDLSGKGE